MDSTVFVKAYSVVHLYDIKDRQDARIIGFHELCHFSFNTFLYLSSNSIWELSVYIENYRYG